MPKLSDYAVSAERLKGVWWDFASMTTTKGNVSVPGSFRVVPIIGNSAFQSAMQEGETKHAATLRDSTIPEENKRQIRRAIWAHAAAEHVLVDWCGWDDLGDYDVAKAVDLLTNPRWMAVAEFIARAMAEQRAAYEREERDALGN